MRNAIRLLAIPLFAVTAHADTVHVPRPARDPSAISDKATMLAPIQVESLTLTPLVATKPIDPKSDSDVLVLDEAFTGKLVAIREKDGGETVNELTLENKSERPLFVMAGEVILGGKQDRIIGANSVIPARSSLAVPVFCVEHGRWDNTSKDFTTANALAHGRLRGRASFGVQQEVWTEVQLTNRARHLENDTDTYRHVAKTQSDGTLAKSEKLVSDALAKVPAAQRAQMIGYVVALNGKVATIDVFSSPALFKKVEAKLVKSYLTESVAIKATADAKPPTTKAVIDFMSDTQADNGTTISKEHYKNSYSITNSYSGNSSGRSSVFLKKPVTPKAAAPATASDLRPPAPAPEPVYESYHAK